jgi:hypothetical protein
MKYITDEEIAQKNWRGRGKSSKVFREVLSMETGKNLLIEPADWGNRKYPPSQVVRYIEKKYNKKFTVLREAANEGWLVKRIK